MKKIALSRFDLGYIIAFVVVGLLGGGAWWWLSGQLQSAVQDVNTAKTSFDKYQKDTKYGVVVNAGNIKILQNNIDILKSQTDLIIPDKLQSKDNKLASIEKEDPVAWKHELDDKVSSLTAAAKTHAVKIPDKFYFGFSRYLSQSPGDEQTTVLSKQLLGIETLANLLITAPVQSILDIRRTYDEDPRPTGNQSNQSFSPPTPGSSNLGGFSINAAGGLYTDYPFEITFDATTENLRTVINGLLQSPYVFVIRSLTIKNSKPASPATTDLDAIAGAGNAGGGTVVGSAPGEVAATTSTVGPRLLFGDDAHLTVTIRVDMIEWKGPQP